VIKGYAEPFSACAHIASSCLKCVYEFFTVRTISKSKVPFRMRPYSFDESIACWHVSI
jgi:hypothetical protein